MSIYEYLLTEAANNVKLTDKQLRYIEEKLNKMYSDELEKMYEKASRKMSKLMDENRFINGYFEFEYDKYINTFRSDIDGFDPYGFREATEDEKELINLMTTMEKDLNAFLKIFNQFLKTKFKNLTAYYESEDGETLSKYIEHMKHYIQQIHRCPSNCINLYVKVNNFKSLIPSELEMDSAKNKKYLGIYENFIKFLHNPAHMPNGLWGGHIADICRILNLSSEKFNAIVSSNFKSGRKFSVKAASFNDPEYAEGVLKDLGDLYIIEDTATYDLVYVPKKKHLYWLNYEHDEIDPFYEKFPYNSREFEDIMYYNDEELKATRELFHKYNKEHNISFE